MMRRRFLLLALVVCSLSTALAEQPWVEVTSPHFSVITDGGEKRAREVTQRFEQMRVAFGVLFAKLTVNTAPLQIIAFATIKSCASILRFTTANLSNWPASFWAMEARAVPAQAMIASILRWTFRARKTGTRSSMNMRTCSSTATFLRRRSGLMKDLPNTVHHSRWTSMKLTLD